MTIPLRDIRPVIFGGRQIGRRQEAYLFYRTLGDVDRALEAVDEKDSERVLKTIEGFAVECPINKVWTSERSLSYALSLSMTGLCEGIAILERERLKQAHVFGGSYGGLVAQYFVRQYAAKVRRLILAHTFVLNPKYAKPLWLAGKLFPALPQCLFVPILRLRLDRMLLSRPRAAHHPEAEFWLNEAIASDLLKEVFIHQNKCLLDLARQPQFTPDDLNGWRGSILIILV